MSELSLLLLIGAFQVKHILGDFVLQSRYMIAHRRIWGHPGGLLHAGIHGALSLPILLAADVALSLVATLLVAEMVTHYLFDWLKDNVVERKGWTPSDAPFWWLTGLDQGLHQLSYLAIAYFALAA